MTREVYPEDSWVAGRAEVAGNEVIIRARQQRPPAEQRAEWPHLVIVSWKFEESSTGMPTVEENARTLRLDEALDAAIDATGAGILAAVITGNGGKEWLFYANDPERFMIAFNAGLEGHERYPLEFEGFLDAEWQALAELVG